MLHQFITAVKPLENHILQVEFISGSKVLLDMSPHLKRLRFQTLQEESVWQSAASSGMRSVVAAMSAAASSVGESASGKTASAGINEATIAGVTAAASEPPALVVDEELMSLEQQREQAKQNLEEDTAETVLQNEEERLKIKRVSITGIMR